MSPPVDMPSLPHMSLYDVVVSALLLGAVSVLVLRKQIAKSVQEFREGLDWRLFRTYAIVFRDKGWEIF